MSNWNLYDTLSEGSNNDNSIHNMCCTWYTLYS